MANPDLFQTQFYTPIKAFTDFVIIKAPSMHCILRVTVVMYMVGHGDTLQQFNYNLFYYQRVYTFDMWIFSMPLFQNIYFRSDSIFGNTLVQVIAYLFL